jgi:hypothetical protein
MAEFTDAQKIGSLHGKLLTMADQFEGALSLFIREGLESAFDQVTLVGKDGQGVRLEIRATRLTPEEISAACAGQAQGGGE